MKQSNEDDHLTWIQFIAVGVCGIRHVIEIVLTLNASFNLKSEYEITNKNIKIRTAATTLVTLFLIFIYALDNDSKFNKRQTNRAQYIDPFFLFEAILGVV